MYQVGLCAHPHLILSVTYYKFLKRSEVTQQAASRSHWVLGGNIPQTIADILIQYISTLGFLNFFISTTGFIVVGHSSLISV